MQNLLLQVKENFLRTQKNLVDRLNIQDSVEFVGWISPAEQINLLSKSAIFVQHSITTSTGDAEGTPVAILEASAAGLPIVSTRHGGIVDTVMTERQVIS